MPFERKVLSTKEVAEYLGLHPSSIYRMLKRGEFTGYKIGADWRFNLEAVEKWRLEHAPARVEPAGPRKSRR